MKKTSIHLIAAIFSLVNCIGLIVLIIILAGTDFATIKSTGLVHNEAKIGLEIIFLACSMLFMIIGVIGSFVSGIIQIVKSEESPVKGFAIAAGILNILGGFFFIGTAFSFYAHHKQN